jgi:peptide/nickel transport system substrate-binding protein
MNPDIQEHPPSTVGSLYTRAVSALPPLEQKIFWIFFALCVVMSTILLFRIANRFMDEVPRYGGTFTEGVIGFPRHINPVIARTDTDRDLALLIYSGLVRKMPDGSFAPDLAESVAMSEDGKIYTAKLRENIHFHDGTPVTSSDVAFTVSAMVDSAREIKGTRRASWEGVTVETPDPHTIVFTLPAPYVPFMEQLTMGIMPAHLWGSLPHEQFDLSNLNLRPVGTGPYIIKTVTLRGDGIPVEYVLQSFDDFALGKPYIKNMIIRFYGNRDELLGAYDAGDIIAISDVDPALGETLAHDGRSRVLSAPLDRVFAVYFNQAHSPVLADKSVRLALEALTDRSGLIASVLHGYGTPINGPVPPGPYDTPVVSTSTPEERLAVASTILEKGGWKKNENGLYQKTDTKKKTSLDLAFAISTGDTDELKAATEFLASTWKTLGGTIDTKVYDKSTLTKDVITPRQYDALLYGAVIDRLPDLLPFWHSSQRTDPGLNIAMYANSKADKFLEQSRGATTTDAGKRALQGFISELNADKPAVFLYSPSFLYGMKGSIGGVTLGAMSTKADRFTSVYEWYTETERVWSIFTRGRPTIIHTTNQTP